MSLLFKKYFTGLLATAMLVCFASCSKNPGDTNFVGGSDLTSTINSRVSGVVTDENNDLVLGATVKVGTSIVTTDKYGFFEVTNATVIKNAATVTVSRPGYFNSIKTYIATENKAAFFRIKLIPKTIAGTVNAVAGGNVALSNGLNISLPPNAVVTASNSTAYNGTVHIAAHWIDPTATDLNQIMPGDLRGLDDGGSLKDLTTYGMAAVELQGDGGELLQIAPGKTATLTFPVPSAIIANAPATIPTWYFDESKGLWKEEGSATKTGNTYVAQVAHFSFWNCDVPNNYVQFNCTVLDNSNHPVPNALVWIHVVSEPYNGRYGYTDASGYVAGAIPDNSELELQVLGDWGCSSAAIYTQTFTTTSSSISLGNIVIPSTSSATVTGNIVNCSAAPVTNGYIITIRNGMVTRYAVDNTGAFNFTMPLCATGTNPVNFIAEDMDGGQQSVSTPVTISAGANALGTLTACGVTAERFFNYTVDGTPYSFTAPGDTIYISNSGLNNILYIGGNRNNEFGMIQFHTAVGMGAGSDLDLELFNSTQTNELHPSVTVQTVHLTEYGAVGEFIAGTYSGTLQGLTSQVITCNFRVRRTF